MEQQSNNSDNKSNKNKKILSIVIPLVVTVLFLMIVTTHAYNNWASQVIYFDSHPYMEGEYSGEAQRRPFTPQGMGMVNYPDGTSIVGEFVDGQLEGEVRGNLMIQHNGKPSLRGFVGSYEDGVDSLEKFVFYATFESEDIFDTSLDNLMSRYDHAFITFNPDGSINNNEISLAIVTIGNFVLALAGTLPEGLDLDGVYDCADNKTGEYFGKLFYKNGELVDYLI